MTAGDAYTCIIVLVPVVLVILRFATRLSTVRRINRENDEYMRNAGYGDNFSAAHPEEEAQQ